MRNTPKEIEQAVMSWDPTLISQLDQDELKRQLMSLCNGKVLTVAALSASDAIKAAIKSHGEAAFVAVLTKIVFFYYESFMDKKDERIQDLAILLSSISTQLKDNAEFVVGLINQLCPREESASTNQFPPTTTDTIDDETEDATYHDAADVVRVEVGTVQSLTVEELSSSLSDDMSNDSSEHKPSPIKNIPSIAGFASPAASLDTTSATTAGTATAKNNSGADFFRRTYSTPAITKPTSSDKDKKERTSSHSGHRRKIRHNDVANDKKVSLTRSGSSTSSSQKTAGIYNVFAPPTMPRPPSAPPPAHLLTARTSSGSATALAHRPAKTTSNDDGPLLVASARIIRRSSSKRNIDSNPTDLAGDDESSASSSRSRRRSTSRKKDDNNDLAKKSSTSRGNSSGEDTQLLVRSNNAFFKPILELDLEEEDMMSAEDLPESQSNNFNN